MPRPSGPHHMTPLDAAYLAECFAICPRTGTLLWRTARPPDHFATTRDWAIWHRLYAGKPAGTVTALGHVQVKTGGRQLYAGRIAYALAHGHDVPPGHRVLYGPRGNGDHRPDNITALVMRRYRTGPPVSPTP